MAKNYFLNVSAKEAFKAYVRAYESHSLKQIFDVQTLDLTGVGKSFGFTVPPHIDIGVGFSRSMNKTRKKESFGNDRKTKIYRQGSGGGRGGRGGGRQMSR
jgi:ATP-dependent RNA helicase DDX18/HAS1